MKIQRIFLIVLDSFGMGALPDAADYGDAGSDTLCAVGSSGLFSIPNLTKLGLLNIDGVCGNLKKDAADSPCACYARAAELSAGKDTTIGHWEIAGLISKEPLPTYPNGFPREIIEEFEKRTGRKVICNKPYSGTQVLTDYGREQISSGALIVYTSADSVFQVAAHEQYIGLKELYRCCDIARSMLTGQHGVGRVIARPYTGEYPDFKRTSNRHDYSIKPTRDTMLDYLHRAGLDTIGIGKIYDIFAGCGVGEQIKTKGNDDGMDKTLQAANGDFKGLCFVNLVDFDMMYGHRNDVDGYAKAISDFDRWLSRMIPEMREDDLLIITADHGCDPSTESTDHSREYVPMLAYGKGIKQGINLGTRRSFADIASTVLSVFDIEGNTDGESFWEIIKN